MLPWRLFRVVSAAILALVICLLTAGSQTRAAVTLISFEAVAEPGKVTLSWETATELGTSGFYVVSSDSENSGYVRISPFIPTTGGGLSGATYSFTDDGLTDGQTYYYKLEMVEVDNSSDFSTAIAAVPGAATPTATRTATATSSPTASGTPAPTATTPQPQPTSAPTDSAYPGPEATATTNAAYPGPPPTQPNPAYPAQATSPAPTSLPAQGMVTPQPTLEQPLAGAAQSPGSAAGPTATLIPQPDIAILLPVASPVPTFATGDGNLAGQEQQETGFPWTRVGPLAFIAVIWIMLGGWFYLSLRQMD